MASRPVDGEFHEKGASRAGALKATGRYLGTRHF